MDKTATIPWGNWDRTNTQSGAANASAMLGNSNYYEAGRTLGWRQYEVVDHLSNVLATILDRKTGSTNTNGQPLTHSYTDPNTGVNYGLVYNYFMADVVSATDYYPGGMPMPGRTIAMNLMRRTNQGQVHDDEIYGVGMESAFKYRMEDTRLNRFWSVDPLAAKYPYNSSYAFSENRLIDGRELEGLEWVYNLYSAAASSAFVKAFNSHDVYNVREVTWNAMNQQMTIVQMMQASHINPGYGSTFVPAGNGTFKAGELKYDSKAASGVTVNYQIQNTQGGITNEAVHYPKGTTKGFEDYNYPVDVRAVNSPEFNNFYQHDFQANYEIHGVSGLAFNAGSGYTSGYLRGFGFVAYDSYITGRDFTIKGINNSYGTMWGDAVGVYNARSLEGYGSSAGFNVEVIEYGMWEGYNNKADSKKGTPNFKGRYGGTTLSATPGASITTSKSKLRTHN